MDESNQFRGIPKEEIFKQLIADRDHHFAHPQSINLRAGVTAVTLCTTLLIALMTQTVQLAPSYAAISLVLVGLLILVRGLYEHNDMHVEQRKRIEKIIQRAIITEDSLADIIKADMDQVSKIKNTVGEQVPIPIFVSEPDLRRGLANHDFKIFGGIVVMVVAIVVSALNAEPRTPIDSGPIRIKFETPLKVGNAKRAP